MVGRHAVAGSAAGRRTGLPVRLSGLAAAGLGRLSRRSGRRSRFRLHFHAFHQIVRRVADDSLLTAQAVHHLDLRAVIASDLDRHIVDLVVWRQGRDARPLGVVQKRVGRQTQGSRTGRQIEMHQGILTRHQRAVLVGDMHLDQQRAGDGVDRAGDMADGSRKGAARKLAAR